MAGLRSDLLPLTHAAGKRAAPPRGPADRHGPRRASARTCRAASSPERSTTSAGSPPNLRPWERWHLTSEPERSCRRPRSRTTGFGTPPYLAPAGGSARTGEHAKGKGGTIRPPVSRVGCTLECMSDPTPSPEESEAPPPDAGSQAGGMSPANPSQAPWPAPATYPGRQPGAPVARTTVALMVAGALLLGGFLGGLAGLGIGFVAGHHSHLVIERHSEMMTRPGFFRGHQPQRGWSQQTRPGRLGGWPSGAPSRGGLPSPSAAPSKAG